MRYVVCGKMCGQQMSPHDHTHTYGRYVIFPPTRWFPLSHRPPPTHLSVCLSVAFLGFIHSVLKLDSRHFGVVAASDYMSLGESPFYFQCLILLTESIVLCFLVSIPLPYGVFSFLFHPPLISIPSSLGFLISIPFSLSFLISIPFSSFPFWAFSLPFHSIHSFSFRSPLCVHAAVYDINKYTMRESDDYDLQFVRYIKSSHVQNISYLTSISGKGFPTFRTLISQAYQVKGFPCSVVSSISGKRSVRIPQAWFLKCIR